MGKYMAGDKGECSRKNRLSKMVKDNWVSEVV